MQSSNQTGNRILDALSPKMLARLHPHLIARELTFGIDIHEPGQQVEFVYFPISGLISVVAEMSDGAAVEINMVGCEGMFSVSTILGDDRPFERAMVQLPGGALRMGARSFQDQEAYERVVVGTGVEDAKLVECGRGARMTTSR